MKKIYMKPTTIEILVDVQPMMGGSENIDKATGFGDQTGGTGSGDVIINSRQGRGFWDEEENEY